jgi:hypothetical protein
VSDFNETWIVSTGFEKYSDIKFHETSSSFSTQTEEQADMKKLIVAFRNFANASNNLRHIHTRYVSYSCVMIISKLYLSQIKPMDVGDYKR